MEELPRLSAFTLTQEPRCGERARRLLDGARGKASAGSTRWRLGQRLREDVALAHAERRVPTRRDFPTPTDLTSEEQAVYAAAAAGYLLLFGDAPAVAIDVPGRQVYDDLGIELAARAGVLVDTDDGTELRILRTRGTQPRIEEQQFHTAALFAPADRLPVRIVAADLLSLLTATATVDAEHVEPARQWLADRVDTWRDAAADNGYDQKDCFACTFVWDCRVHRGGR